MKFDSIDLAIFNTFVENDTLSSTDIAKLVFKPKNRDELIVKNNLIDYRLKKWLKSGLIIYTLDNKIKKYNLNDDIITFGESKLSINGTSVDMGNALIIDMKNNGYIVKFLDEE